MTFAHRFIPGGSASDRTLVLLHGTGGDETSLLEIGGALDGAANLMGIRGQSTEEGVNRFFRRLREGVFDLEDLQSQATLLAAFLIEARRVYNLTGPFCAVGYSNGANMAASLMLLHPSALDEAVLLRSMLPIEPETRPHLAGKRIFMANGRLDPMAPADSAERLAKLFTDCGAAVDQCWWPGGHELTREDVSAAAEWLRG